MNAFWIALFFVFIAEMGDKTQLVAMAFATRYRATIVLAAVFAATLLVHVFSVFIGEAAGRLLPIFWINISAGLAFIGYGIWTLKGDDLEEDKTTERKFGPFLTVGITFFLAELGDKTMLTTITIASQQQNFIAVWLGSTVGMVVADGLAILVGKVMHKQLPENILKFAIAPIFILSGLVTLAETLMHH